MTEAGFYGINCEWHETLTSSHILYISPDRRCDDIPLGEQTGVVTVNVGGSQKCTVGSGQAPMHNLKDSVVYFE